MRRKSWEVNGLAGPTPPVTPGRGKRREGFPSFRPSVLPPKGAQQQIRLEP